MSYTYQIEKLRRYFYENNTQTYEFRKRQLLLLKKVIKENEEHLVKALHKDFKKPEAEVYLTELAMLYLEIDFHVKNLKRWMRPQRVSSSFLNFPSTDYLIAKPYGVALIISPWNYPLLLAIHPLISSIAAGNCTFMKLSEIATHTSLTIKQIIESSFTNDYIVCEIADAEQTTELLKQRFDKIFFTGSTKVGAYISEAASKHLTPVTLELGGKSPCVIDESANLTLAAKRIAFGKFVNAGQTCIAPDFVWIHKSVKNMFLKELKHAIESLYCSGKQQKTASIINSKNYNRLSTYLIPEQIFFGGYCIEEDLYISPTILDNVSVSDSIMQEEIFGPILPILTYDDENEIIAFNHLQGKPLAFYWFTSRIKQVKETLNTLQYGGACINDVLSHIVNHKLPFGGFGKSGMGNYHGKYGFNAFTHLSTLVDRKTYVDIAFKYPPYDKKIKLIKKFIHRFL